jgi:RHS repeat-associated protein
MNGAVSYTYDPVGNRTQKVSTLPGYPGGLLNYNANDQLTTDAYDAEGNTVGSGTNTGANGYVYDFENHLLQQGGIIYVYDGDGHRVYKTVAGVTTASLIDGLTPTGYPQVVREDFYNGTGPGELTHRYYYGLERLSEARDFFPGSRQYIYYVYDGHGSVRALTDQTGAVTDTYDYDAFGTLLHSTGTTYNNFLFAGEQFDPDLGLYYNRARYMNASTGRFWSMDTYEGDQNSPASLHKYLYANADPVNAIDPSGKFSLSEVTEAAADMLTIASRVALQARTVLTSVYLNVWRLPFIIEQVSVYVTLASGAIAITHAASQALPELTRNLRSADQEYSPGPSPRGFQVESAAGANLSPTNRDFDDFRYGELTQIKSTVQVQTKESLLALIRRDAQRLGATRGPYVLNTRDGARITVEENQVTGKNLFYVIPDEALNFTQQSLLPVIQEIEESEGVQIGVQAVKGLRGQP